MKLHVISVKVKKLQENESAIGVLLGVGYKGIFFEKWRKNKIVG